MARARFPRSRENLRDLNLDNNRTGIHTPTFLPFNNCFATTTVKNNGRIRIRVIPSFLDWSSTLPNLKAIPELVSIIILSSSWHWVSLSEWHRSSILSCLSCKLILSLCTTYLLGTLSGQLTSPRQVILPYPACWPALSWCPPGTSLPTSP